MPNPCPSSWTTWCGLDNASNWLQDLEIDKMATRLRIRGSAMKWLLLGIFVVFSVLSLFGWYLSGNLHELARAVGFALGVPHLFLFPTGEREESTAPVTRSRLRPFTSAAWWMGLALIVLAQIPSSWS